MALVLSSSSSSSSFLFSSRNPITIKPSLLYSSKIPTNISFYFFDKPSHSLRFTSQFQIYRKPLFRCSSSSFSEPESDTEPEAKSEVGTNPEPSPSPVIITDEWGEKTELEPESENEYPVAAKADPPKDEDEWEEEEEEEEKMEYGSGENGRVGAAVKDERIEELKRCLLDTIYGTNFGFQASPEVRGEVLELVNQLEALNPTPEPVDSSQILDGNWVLLYTAFSELLPLLAVGSVPLLKVEKISQAVDSSNLTIVNSTTLSSPFASFSFSATASFEVRSSSRIQVEFKEGTLQPPEIKSRIDLPGNIDVFGQNISLSPVQQSLDPLQEAVANISRTISGQPPFKVPIPGDRSRSWLLITFLDKDLRISRGDGGLFVLIKEGSPLLDY